MKSTMKKITASLLALLMMIQLVPVFAATYSSGMIAGTAAGYKEMLEIVASKGTYVLVGQTLVLDVNEDYMPEWKSENPAVATINAQGVITAVAAGYATITATVKDPKLQTATIEITVIDPEPILTEETPEEDGQEEQTTDASELKALVVVINGENERITYDGEEHILDRFVATANEDFFDESKIKVEGELGVTGKDCGIYEMALDSLTFIYDDETVEAHFVINNGFMKITPAQATITANDATKNKGEEDPELTATVEGLFGEDTLEYTLARSEGEEAGDYVIEVTGEEEQGNYRISYESGKFTIAGEAEVTGEPSVEIETSLLPGQKVFKGTEVTLTSIPSGFGSAELTYQWQYSTDGENWTDIEGANGKEYTYIVNKENAKYYYRVQVDTAD